jgi:hypothetical protein
MCPDTQTRSRFMYVIMCPDTQPGCSFWMWSCVHTHRHKTVHRWITNDCNLTREPCIASLQSNKMCTRALYTPSILHTLHTRPGIDSHMSREGTLTDWTSSRDVSRTVRTHTQTSTSKSVLCTRLTPPTSQNKLYHVKFDCVSSPVWCRFYMLPCVQKQRHSFVSECGNVSTHTDTKPSTVESQTTVI